MREHEEAAFETRFAAPLGNAEPQGAERDPQGAFRHSPSGEHGSFYSAPAREEIGGAVICCCQD
jgi:hypothetical protein